MTSKQGSKSASSSKKNRRVIPNGSTLYLDTSPRHHRHLQCWSRQERIRCTSLKRIERHGVGLKLIGILSAEKLFLQQIKSSRPPFSCAQIFSFVDLEIRESGSKLCQCSFFQQDLPPGRIIPANVAIKWTAFYFDRQEVHLNECIVTGHTSCCTSQELIFNYALSQIF